MLSPLLTCSRKKNATRWISRGRGPSKPVLCVLLQRVCCNVAPLLPRDELFADCGYLNVLVHCQFEHSHLNFVSNAAGKGENSPVYVWHTWCTVSRSTRCYDPNRAFISCTYRTCCPTLSKRWILRWLRVSKCSCAHDNHVHVHNHALFVQLMKALLG